ncbi:MAG TPA: glycosyltransferase [Polyangia bacterium]
MRVAFVHPVLGLGGAERLVVDAALELRARGHAVTIFTTEHDAGRAFPETCDGRVEVQVRGRFLPAAIGGRLQAPCAIARLCWLAGTVAAGRGRFDAIVSDIAPYALPLLRATRALHPRAPHPRLVYYCHYPDQLLAPPRAGWYRAYRAPLDGLEGPAMRAADLVLANSHFTARAVAALGVETPSVLYPGVNLADCARIADQRGDESSFLVVSRFDPRKNQRLALEAFARLREVAPAVFARTSLTLAGGLDRSRREDRDTAAAVTTRVRELALDGKVTLVPSPSEAERLVLLERSLCVVHPAPDEHFGIVPVEAMAAGRPVVAVARAGPLESVVDGVSGLLREPTPEAFAEAMGAVAEDAALRARLAREGRARAALFSRQAFGDGLERALRDVVGARAGGGGASRGPTPE